MPTNESPPRDQVQVISDGDGLAIIGTQDAVETFLTSAGWQASLALDLRRLMGLLGAGANAAQAASEIASNCGRWVKLTEESAATVKEWGLTPSKTPGQSHLMVGAPGSVQSWLQTEQGFGSLLSNPALLTGLSGVLAQAAMRQSMAEIVDYLATIDEKVDDVLRKVDDTVVAQTAGAKAVIDEALTIRDETGSVNQTQWSKVDQTPRVIASTEAYALDQLQAITTKLENGKIKGLASATAEATRDVPKWLAVLARCSQMRDGVAVLELDRVLAESPLELDGHRRGLRKARQERRSLIADHTARLLTRMDTAVDAANAKMLWTLGKSLEVVGAANHVAAGIHEFHGLLNIESAPLSWDPRQLGRGANLGSQAIQQGKEKGPAAVVVGLGLAGLAAKSTKDPH